MRPEVETTTTEPARVRPRRRGAVWLPALAVALGWLAPTPAQASPPERRGHDPASAQPDARPSESAPLPEAASERESEDEPAPDRWTRRKLEWPIGKTDPVHLGVTASYWARGELRDEPARADALDWRIVHRARLGGWARYRGLTAYVRAQDVRGWGSESGVRATDPSFGLAQGYVELAGETGKAAGFIRFGRQSLSYGSQRVVGPALWNPHTQNLDGLRAYGEYGPVMVDLAGALVRRPETLSLEDGDLDVAGEWLGVAELAVRPHRAFELETYFIAHNAEPTAAEPERHRLVFSPGARVLGNPVDGLHYELEGYVQTGTWDRRAHRAWSGAATLRYELELGPVKPAVLASYTLASGTPCTAAPEPGVDAGTCSPKVHRDFDTRFGSRHRYLGYADLFRYQNVRDLLVGPELAVGEWMDAQLHYHYFQLHEADGAWIRTSGAPVGAGWDPDNEDHTLGHELDLRLRFRPWWPLTVMPGYSLFMPAGAGAELLGDDRPIHFAYLLVAAEF